MIPKKATNIYPKNITNVNALIKFHFADLELELNESVDYIMAKSSLELNQIEFICRKIHEGYLKVFRPNLTGQITLKNLLEYAVGALTLEEFQWKGSKNRIRITKEFRDFVKQTEINIDYLERNN